MTSHAEQGTTEQYRSNRRARRIRKVLLLCPLGKKVHTLEEEKKTAPVVGVLNSARTVLVEKGWGSA